MKERVEVERPRTLVVMAHPDDAELSSGGSVARWVKEGCEVRYVICTNGDKGTKDPDLSPHQLAQIREQEQEMAAAVLGVSRVIFLRHRDGELEATLAFRQQLATLIRDVRPQRLVTHDPWRHYLIHPDHRAVGTTVVDAVVAARDYLFLPELAALGLKPHPPQELLFTFPDQPDFFVDITSTLERKLEAIAQHRSQMERSTNWQERIRERAQQAGEKANCPYAEAFKRVALS